MFRESVAMLARRNWCLDVDILSKRGQKSTFSRAGIAGRKVATHLVKRCVLSRVMDHRVPLRAQHRRTCRSRGGTNEELRRHKQEDGPLRVLIHFDEGLKKLRTGSARKEISSSRV